jgi:hypothetical protein
MRKTTKTISSTKNNFSQDLHAILTKVGNTIPNSPSKKELEDFLDLLRSI